MLSLAQLIRRYREERGWDPGRLAEAVGMSKAWVSRVEKGSIKRPDADILRKTARALRIPPEVLLAAAGYEVSEVPRAERRLSEELADILRRVLELEEQQEAGFPKASPTEEVEGCPPKRTRTRVARSSANAEPRLVAV